MRSFRNVLTATVATALVLSACAVAVPANAAPLVDQTQTITNNGSGGPVCFDMGGVYTQGLGSAFTAGLSGLLSSIEFPITGTSALSSGFTVTVWNVDEVSGLPTGPAIAAQAVSLETLNPLRNGGNLNVVFDTPPTIVAAEKYAFLMDFPATCTGSYNQVTLALGISDPDKIYFTRQNNAFVLGSGYGMSFTTSVEVPTPTPSPSASASPTTAPAASLAKTGAEVDWLLLGSLIAVVSGAGFFALGRRRRTE